MMGLKQHYENVRQVEGTWQLSWFDIEYFIQELHYEITKSYPTQENFHVVGITKGGVIPATLLAKKLNASLDVLDPDGDPDTWNILRSDKIVIIVDDISDSGKTLRKIFSNVPSNLGDYIKVATLCFRKTTEFEPDWSALKVFTDAWMVFPWENGVEK